MNATYDIQWRPMRDIPNTPGFKLTVKRNDGELINTQIMRDRATGANYLSGITADHCKGWIPNDQQ